MSRTDRIKKLLAEQNEINVQHAQNLKLQKRLNILVHKYGEDEVALATELSVATIRQYLRTKNPIIGDKAITQAEYIFKNI
mgnify:CR=1 FL=1